jgi:anaerobic magnesium-protoporphyrin IX monomethyl ester cyclase
MNVDSLSRKDFVKLAKKQKYFLISCYTDSLENVKRIILDLRKINPKAFILCGGPHCSLFEEHIKGSDVSVYGEAEGLIDEIIDRLFNKKSLHDIAGLSYYENGSLIRNPGIMSVSDLNKSLAPALTLSKGKNYGYFNGIKLGEIAPIMSSRGCPFNCSFCTYKGRVKYRELSVDSVINELKRIRDMGYKYAIFSDDNFLLNKKRAMNIMNRIIEEKIKLKMLIECRVDSADYELYKKLREAGVFIIQFGIESVNQDVLDYFNKRVTVDQIRNAVRTANSAGLITIGLFITGAPMEDNNHLNATKEFFEKEPLDFMVMGILKFIKGSDLWDQVYNKKLVKDKDYIVPVTEIYKNRSLNELKNNIKYLISGFYKNPERIIRIISKLIKAGELGILLNMFKGLFSQDFIKSIIEVKI